MVEPHGYGIRGRMMMSDKAPEKIVHSERCYFRAIFAALELIDILKEKPPSRILDIGGGRGVHANFFRSHGHHVDLVDIVEGEKDQKFVGDFMDFVPSERYDVIWSSHVFEHIMNPGDFIRHMMACCKEGGLIAITVPPQKKEMIFEHVSLWIPGLLLIFLIRSGLDCRQLRLYAYSYNISVIVPLKFTTHDNCYEYLPREIPVENGYFPGDLKKISWKTTVIPNEMRIPYHGDKKTSHAIEYLNNIDVSGFIICRDEYSGNERFHWWDAARKNLVLVS